MAYPMKDMKGLKFGRLTVLGICHEKKYAGSSGAFWKCECECGTVKSIWGRSLRTGHTLSCGCLNKEIVTVMSTKHGATGTRTHRIWSLMKGRCLNPTNKDFKDYGGRGVTVCERWREFEGFLTDMGEAPDGMSIDRFPDMNGSYEPGNCRWATPKEQSRNRRVLRLVTHAGRTQCIAAWAEELGISANRITRRIDKGMAFEAIVRNTPKDPVDGLGNTTGFRGVKKARNKWSSLIYVDGERMFLGTFDTAEAASSAYEAAKSSIKKSLGA